MELKRVPKGMVLRYTVAERESLRDSLEAKGTEQALALAALLKDKSLIIPPELAPVLREAMTGSE